MNQNFEISNSILIEEKEENLMSKLAETEAYGGFLLFRPKITNKLPTGDCVIDAVLAIIDFDEQNNKFGTVKPGYFLMNSKGEIYAKVKSPEDIEIIKLYTHPFNLVYASVNLINETPSTYAVYDCQKGISFRSENEIVKAGDTYVTNDTKNFIVEKTRDKNGKALETRIFDRLASGRKNLIATFNRDLVSESNMNAKEL